MNGSAVTLTLDQGEIERPGVAVALTQLLELLSHAPTCQLSLPLLTPVPQFAELVRTLLPPQQPKQQQPPQAARAGRGRLVSRADIDAALQQTGGNATKAAQLLCIGRATLYRRKKVGNDRQS